MDNIIVFMVVNLLGLAFGFPQISILDGNCVHAVLLSLLLK